MMDYTRDRIKFNSKLYRPMMYVQLYLVGVIMLYLLGPLEWKTQNPFLFYTFISIAQILLLVGFIFTMKKLQYRAKMSETNTGKEAVIVSHDMILKFLRIFITVNLVVTIMYLMRNTGLASFSIKLIMNNLSKGIADSATQYLGKFEEQILFGGRWLAPMITLTSPILWPVLPLSFIYFKKLEIYNKIITVLTVFFEAARWISTGTNKGVIDLILIIIFIFFLKLWQKSYQQGKNQKNIGKRNIITILIVAILIVVGFAYFSNNIGSRLNKNYDTVSLITGDTEVNLNSPIIKMMPDSLEPLIVYATQYLTQGYYGLSLSLDEPFIPMFGVGNSIFLIENLQELSNKDLYQYTYSERISDEGWDPFMNWHSAYMWLANDLSYYGVLVLMFFFGKYFAHVTFKSIAYNDPIASVLFCLILLLFFYLPCNNQIFSSPLTFMAFWGLNALWLFKNCTRSRSLNNRVWIDQ